MQIYTNFITKKIIYFFFLYILILFCNVFIFLLFYGGLRVLTNFDDVDAGDSYNTYDYIVSEDILLLINEFFKDYCAYSIIFIRMLYLPKGIFNFSNNLFYIVSGILINEL